MLITTPLTKYRRIIARLHWPAYKVQGSVYGSIPIIIVSVTTDFWTCSENDVVQGPHLENLHHYLHHKKQRIRFYIPTKHLHHKWDNELSFQGVLASCAACFEKFPSCIFVLGCGGRSLEDIFTPLSEDFNNDDKFPFTCFAWRRSITISTTFSGFLFVVARAIVLACWKILGSLYSLIADTKLHIAVEHVLQQNANISQKTYEWPHGTRQTVTYKVHDATMLNFRVAGLTVVMFEYLRHT